jgi:IS30 family transposase
MSRSYSHVTRDERCQIYALKSSGLSQNSIAAKLNRASSSIGRELKRNSKDNVYQIEQSHEKSCSRRSLASHKPKKMDSKLIDQIEDKLNQEWSPEQISGRLETEGTMISHESIYRHVRADKVTGGELYKKLRHGGKPYKKRVAGKKAGRGCIPNRVDISERPEIVETKSRIGDWEGDTIISTGSKTALLTYVDRNSKFTLLSKLGRKLMENVRTATVDLMAKLPHKVHSITYDNGMEFACHQKIAKELDTKCYFATPYHSWERGLNEHTNGLARQFLPKNFDFKDVTDEEIQQIQDKLNHRPRKVLNFKTPFEVFYAG